MSTRDTIRGKIFASKEFSKRTVEFFGEKIELRQPSLGLILQVQDEEDRKSAVIDTLIKYAYVPETDEKVFEDGDEASLLALPFGPDFIRVSNALEELTQVNFLDKGTSSGPGQTSTS